MPLDMSWKSAHWHPLNMKIKKSILQLCKQRALHAVYLQNVNQKNGYSAVFRGNICDRIITVQNEVKNTVDL